MNFLTAYNADIKWEMSKFYDRVSFNDILLLFERARQIQNMFLSDDTHIILSHICGHCVIEQLNTRNDMVFASKDNKYTRIRTYVKDCGNKADFYMNRVRCVIKVDE